MKGLAEKSIPRAQARTLYEDTTPPFSPEEIEARRLERILAPSRAPGRPDRRNQRVERDRKRWSGV